MSGNVMRAILTASPYRDNHRRMFRFDLNVPRFVIEGIRHLHSDGIELRRDHLAMTSNHLHSVCAPDPF